MTINITAILTQPSFAGFVQQEMIRKNALIQTGIMQVNPQLSAFMATGGNVTTVDSWQPLVNDADQVSTNDTTVTTSYAVLSSQELAPRLVRSNTWASGDLVAAISGLSNDPLKEVVSGQVEYWNARLQATMLAILAGVIADNVANDSGDMVNDITGTYALGTTTFGAGAFEDTLLTLSDMMDGVTGIIMHPVVYTRAKKNDLIDFEKDSDGRPTIAFYRGLRVFVDATMPVSTNDYTTYILGPGVIQFGTAPVKKPYEIHREPLEGTGGGMEYFIGRQQWCIHPRGFSYIGTATNAGPANSTLDDAASWNRVWAARKQIKFAVIKTTEA